MPFSDFRLMALALVVIAFMAVATGGRALGWWRWCGPKVRRLVQKCRAKLQRKPKVTEVHYDNSWTFQYGEHEPDPAGPPDYRSPDKPAPRPRTKRRPKK
jgi:hypothetical protein